MCSFLSGAQDETRTHTNLRPQAPQACVSTIPPLEHYGARSGNRTRTVFLPWDFKSHASTYSAIRAQPHRLRSGGKTGMKNINLLT